MSDVLINLIFILILIFIVSMMHEGVSKGIPFMKYY